MPTRVRTLRTLGIVALAVAGHDACADPTETLRIVKPCATSAAARPVLEECVAAALAENAISQDPTFPPRAHIIFARVQNQREWQFLVELGDAQHPAGPGE